MRTPGQIVRLLPGLWKIFSSAVFASFQNFPKEKDSMAARLLLFEKIRRKKCHLCGWQKAFLRKAERDYCFIIKQRDGREERMITVPSSITVAPR